MDRQNAQHRSGGSRDADHARAQTFLLLPSATGSHQDADCDGTSASASMSESSSELVKRDPTATAPGSAADALRSKAPGADGPPPAVEAGDGASTPPEFKAATIAEVLEELRKLRNDFNLVEDLQKQLDQLRSELINRDVLRPVLVSLMEISEGLGVLSADVGRKAKPMAREDIVTQLTRLSVKADRALKRHGAQRTVVTAGECFKPELHAIAKCVAAPTPAAIGKVSQVFQHAFVDENGRALRLALVNVYSAS